MSYQMEIRRDDCLSAGKCVADYPHVFCFDDEELSSLLPDSQLLPKQGMLRVARNCPGQAIVVTDEDGIEVGN